MTTTSSGMVVQRFAAYVAQLVVLDFLVPSLVVFWRILISGKMTTTDTLWRKSLYMIPQKMSLLKLTYSTKPNENTNSSDRQLDMDNPALSGSSGGTHIAESNESVSVAFLKTEQNEEMNLESKDTVQVSFGQDGCMVADMPSSGAIVVVENKQVGNLRKSLKPLVSKKMKMTAEKQVDPKLVIQMLSSKEAQQDVLLHEDIKIDAVSELDIMYSVIRPAIEARERDTQESLPTSIAEKWIEASCAKYKAEFDQYGSVIKNLISNFKPTRNEPKLLESGEYMDSDQNKNDETKYLTY